MDGVMDLFSTYIMGLLQMLTGFYFFVKFFQKKIKWYFYFLFGLASAVLIRFLMPGRLSGFAAYGLLLAAAGLMACRADWKSVILYDALTIEIMHLCYGLTDSLLSGFYPAIASLPHKTAGVLFILLGNSAMIPAVCCFHIVCRYFSCYEAARKQYVLMLIIPVLMIFFAGEYISLVISENLNASGSMEIPENMHYPQIFFIQLLGLASLFCVMAAYKKLMQNVELATQLSLLRQEEHFLNQYVTEAKARYEKTRSFRHDIKNHMTVIREFLKNAKLKEALQYMEDMEAMAEELSFSCSTNHPTADILIGNKLGIAESMGIDASCSLVLPYPCFVRDIDFGIILSNALDNAIHACEKMDAGAEKYISVTGRMQGDFILMEIENSFQGNGQPVKGTGLSNIRTAAEKYQGAVSIHTQNGVFRLSVLLIIPQHSGSISQQPALSAVSDSRKKEWKAGLRECRCPAAETPGHIEKGRHNHGNGNSGKQPL